MRRFGTHLHAQTLSIPALCAVLAAAAWADDWPQWLGPGRNGISAETGWQAAFPPNGPKVLWKVNVGVGYSSMAVSKGYLYTLGNRRDVDTLFRFNARTGALSWKHPYDCPAIYPKGLLNIYPGPRSTPAIADGRVYSFSRAGQLFCLDETKGTVVWSADVRKGPIAAKIPTWGFACSPLVLGRWVILDAGPIVALDKVTGKLAWKSRHYTPGYSSPVTISVDGRLCVAAFNGEGLTVVSAADGKHVLLHPFRVFYNENCVTPVVSGNQCFVSAGHRPGCALLKLADEEATVLWRNRNMLNHVNNAVLWKGHLYGFHGNVLGFSSLRCVEFATGKKKWSYGKLGKGALILADGKLVIMNGTGELVIAEASPEAFKPLAQAKVLTGTCWTLPVLADGRIYCRNHNGDVVCLNVRAQPKDSK